MASSYCTSLQIKRPINLLAYRSWIRQILHLLVGAECPINARNMMGDTPLHLAAINGHALAVEYLVGSGADVNARYTY